MNNSITIDEVLTPLSKWINRSLFNDQFDRTLSQRVEDNLGIPKKTFHVGLGVVGIFLLAKWFDSRN